MSTTKKSKEVSKLININILASKVLDRQKENASAQLATDELNRMIDLHKTQAINLDARIKRYLLGHANGKYIGKYQGLLESLAPQYVIHHAAVEYLEGLKIELGAK